MYSLSTAGLAALLLTLALTPLVRGLAIRLGWVDRPDQPRKVHVRPVPRIGGVAIMLAYVAAFAILWLLPLKGGALVEQALPFVVRLLPAALLVFLTGLLDDLIGLKPWQKLAGQLAASALAIWGGVWIQAIAEHALPPWLSAVVTVAWLIACTNAFNLIDGVDGLASGVGLFATLTIMISALFYGHYPLALATAPLAGSLLGFLRFNFNPASIFLGDCGSLWIGFLLGCYGVVWSQKSATILGMTAPLMALSIPLVDTGVAVFRRLLRRQPLFAGDRNHIHHRLLERGWTPRRAVLLLYGVACLAAIFSLVQNMLQNRYGGIVILVFCAAAWIGIQYLGYAEFTATGRLIHPSTFFRMLDAQLRLRTLEETLADARSVEDCWRAICEFSRQFGFNRAVLRVNGSVYEQRWNGARVGADWSVRIPLSDTEYLNLGRRFNGTIEPLAVAPLVEVLQRGLREACARFERVA